MKGIVITLIALLAIALPLGAASRKNSSEGQPQVVLAEKSYDFGTVSSSAKPVVHEFTLTNSGSAPLVIISATATCGCTRPTFTPKPIDPGKSGSVKVTFLPAGQAGNINKEIKVKTNAPGAKRITLRLTGHVTND